MADVDLAALTEAVYGRMLQSAHPDVSSLIRPSPLVVRAVLEALPREWAVRHDNAPCDGGMHRGPWSTELNWVESRAARCSGCYVVWRAVGPPIPAEEQP